MSGILTKLGKAAAGLVVKKVTTVEPDGSGGTEAITKTRPRLGIQGLGWIAGFLVVWHFIMHPVLSWYLPHINFPALDSGWISGILLGL